MPENVTDIVNRWATRTKSQEAKTKWSGKIKSLQTNPMEQAAANKTGYVNGVVEAANNGKWEKGLRRWDLPKWQQHTVAKGEKNITTGVDAGVSKFTGFMNNFYPYTQTVKSTVRAMPKGDKEQSRARMNKAFDMMSDYKRPD